MIDFIEFSGGKVETKTNRLHTSFSKELDGEAPQRTSMGVREAFLTKFAEKMQELKTNISIQLSGRF